MTTHSVQSDSSVRTPTSHSTDEDSRISSSTSTGSLPLGHNEYNEEDKRNGACRMVESDTDSDKDLVITSLTESLQIHKEILERLHNEKQEFIANIEKERQSEREATEKEKELAQQALEEQMERYRRLESNYATVVKELEARKEEFKRMEANFYAHVRSIRPTDDDLSTIQYEINHLSGQLNNFCMGLKSKMDRSGGTAYILERWSDREDAIKQHLYKPDSEDERLEPGVITMFTEKLITDILTKDIFNQPIHAGVSVNETFKNLSDWMEPRNPEWAGRLRQQVSALVVKQPGIEQDKIDNAIKQVVTKILDGLSNIYPRVKDGEAQKKKVENIVAKAAKLNLAMKGQDIKVFCAPIEEGVAAFDERLMKPVSRSEPNGTVIFVISPPFVAVDPKDEDHGFIIHAKVFCA